MQLFGKQAGRRFAVAACAATMTGAGLVGLAAFAWAGTSDIEIDNFTFGPQELTVKVGDTVTWTNRDDIPHNVRASGGATFKCAVMDTGATCQIPFTTAGEFTYFCGLHPKMTGKVIVKE
jgi:plastocyanin